MYNSTLHLVPHNGSMDPWLRAAGADLGCLWQLLEFKAVEQSNSTMDKNATNLRKYFPGNIENIFFFAI